MFIGCLFHKKNIMEFNRKKILRDIVDLKVKIEDSFSQIDQLSNLYLSLINSENIDVKSIEKCNEDLSTKLLINKLYLGLFENLNSIINQFDDYDSIEIDDYENDIVLVDELREEWLNKTKEKEVLFNDYHPYYDDSYFFKEIFNFFEVNEEYEMCKYLLNIQKLKTEKV
jgi:hypothetical protein